MARAGLFIERGDSLVQVIDWDQSLNGPPVSLAGYTATAVIVVGDVTYELSEGSGLTVDDTNGRITMVLTPEETQAFTEQFGDWRLYVLSPSDVGTTLAEGFVFVSFGAPYAA
jgi:hypothetical protein